jgi:hypothetical protein
MTDLRVNDTVLEDVSGGSRQHSKLGGSIYCSGNSI